MKAAGAIGFIGIPNPASQEIPWSRITLNRTHPTMELALQNSTKPPAFIAAEAKGTSERRAQPFWCCAIFWMSQWRRGIQIGVQPRVTLVNVEYNPRGFEVKREIQMNYLLILCLCFFLASTSNVLGQSKTDEEAVTKLALEFSDAWAKHDGHALAKIMAEDVDFVTVATTYLHGRADFETFHVRLLSGRFKDSKLTVLKSTTRFLRPDMAVVHWSWKIEGDNNPDGTPGPPRFGMMTLVAEKKNGNWLVVVGQNTNAILGIPPELQDIKTPIAIPGTALEP